MFVRWQNSETVAKRKQPGKVNRCRAILVESVRVDGKPKQQYIAFLASFEPDVVAIKRDMPEWRQRRQFGAQCRFWRQLNKRLNRLGNRISLDDRHKIEAALAIRVPRPSQEEQERSDREVEEMLRDLRSLRSEPNGARAGDLVHYDDGVSAREGAVG